MGDEQPKVLKLKDYIPSQIGSDGDDNPSPASAKGDKSVMDASPFPPAEGEAAGSSPPSLDTRKEGATQVTTPKVTAPQNAASQVDDSGQDGILIGFAEKKKVVKAKEAFNEKSQGVKRFSDDLYELILSHKNVGAHEIAAVMAHFVKDLSNIAFDGLHPEKKREQREKLRQLLVDVISKKKSDGR